MIPHNANAFSMFREPLLWRQDRHPHTSGEVQGIVLHGSSEDQGAGHPSARIYADPYSVIIEWLPAVCAGISVGDTLKRLDETVLTVQQITRDRECGWVAVCTASERASV